MNNIADKKLVDLINSKEIQKILEVVNASRMHKTICPQPENVFRALKLCPLSQTKVVIFGQDPYHSKNVADGLAFSTQNYKTPPSLQNIFKELKLEYPNILIETNDLSSWAKQGILLLNTILTVEENKPLSHQNIGWNHLILNIIEIINSELEGVIFLLWGNQAKLLKNYINTSKHFVLYSAHPSPFSFEKGFKNNGHFKKVNEILSKQNRKNIDWNLIKK